MWWLRKNEFKNPSEKEKADMFGKIRFLCVTPWFAPVVCVWAPGRKAFWAEYYHRKGRPQLNKMTTVLTECPYLVDEYPSPIEAIAAVPQDGSPDSPRVLAFSSREAMVEYLKNTGQLAELKF
jgi:hypothetical protein